MLKNRQIKRIAKIAEKILKKSYRNRAYFTIEKITVFLGYDLDDYVELYCNCGFEHLEDGEPTGEYTTKRFMFNYSKEVIGSCRTCAAILALHAIEVLDEFEYFSEV